MHLKDRIHVTAFDNGIYLYNMPNSLLNLSAIGFRSGSINDPPGMSGMNHLVEHLTCRRGIRYNERDVELLMSRYMGGTHGGGINVRCDRSSVLYGHDDVRFRRYMWKCFDMYADVVKSVILDAQKLGPRILTPSALKVEKAAVHNEYRANGTDAIEAHLYDLVHWHLYKHNPARKRVDCSREDLKNINSLRSVRSFIRERYTPDNMFVVLIGPQNSQAVDKVREYFGDLELSPGSLPLVYDHSDDFPRLDRVYKFEIIRPGIRQHHVAIGFPTEPYGKDQAVLEILGALWEARIERRLREENLSFNSGIYHPDIYYPQTATQGLIMAMFPTVGDSNYVEYAINIAIEECEKIKTDDSLQFTQDCEAMRDYLFDAFYEMLAYYPLTLCEMITEATCNGDVELKHFFTYPKRLKRVTPGRVRSAARKYFTSPDRYIRVVAKPLIVPQHILRNASEDVRPYLEAINYDEEFALEVKPV